MPVKCVEDETVECTKDCPNCEFFDEAITYLDIIRS